MPDRSQQEGASEKPQRKGIRWWPAFLIILLAVAAIIFVRSSYGRHRQDQNIAIANIVIISFLLLIIWCILLSRLRWQVRWSIVGSALCAIGLVAALFRIHGVTGDLVPILEPRWNKRSFSLEQQRARTVSPRSDAYGPLTNDYPQFLGPQRNGTLEHSFLTRNCDWKAHPPERLWKRQVGPGWSGFAVAGRYAVTQEQREENETIICYDLLSGEQLWAYAYPAHFQSSLAGEGPRATPAIAEGRVYALGSMGDLNCVSLETGKPIWSKNILKDNVADMNEWGVSCSPLVTDGLVIVSAGGQKQRSLVAYRAATGDFAWGGGTDGPGYSSPFQTTLSGTRQVLIFNDAGVVAHSLEDGKILWRYHWPGGHPHVAMPVLLPNDRLLISSGYGIGSEVIQIKKDSGNKFTATRLWKSTRLKAKFTNLVYYDGFVYGLDDGIMVCLDAETGELKWKEGRYGHGQEILAKDLLLVSAETGDIVLLEPRPDKPREITRFSSLNQKTWNPPALAGEYLLVRNDKEAACFKIHCPAQ